MARTVVFVECPLVFEMPNKCPYCGDNVNLGKPHYVRHRESGCNKIIGVCTRCGHEWDVITKDVRRQGEVREVDNTEIVMWEYVGGLRAFLGLIKDAQEYLSDFQHAEIEKTHARSVALCYISDVEEVLADLKTLLLVKKECKCDNQEACPHRCRFTNNSNGSSVSLDHPKDTNLEDPPF